MSAAVSLSNRVHDARSRANGAVWRRHGERRVGLPIDDEARDEVGGERREEHAIAVVTRWPSRCGALRIAARSTAAHRASRAGDRREPLQPYSGGCGKQAGMALVSESTSADRRVLVEAHVFDRGADEERPIRPGHRVAHAALQTDRAGRGPIQQARCSNCPWMGRDHGHRRAGHAHAS